jgi:Spx/MgsR family transcriptional regulator
MKVHGIVNCDTVRKARAWLGERGVEYEFVDLRKTPPSRTALARWCAVVGWETLLNRRGTTWRKLAPALQARVVDATSAIDAMLAHPSAIKRPVVEAGVDVIVGFDPADWERRFATRRPGGDADPRLR